MVATPTAGIRMTPEQLRTWREARGLSQQQVAELLGVTPFTVYRWEHGDRNPPAGYILDLALAKLDDEMAAVVEDLDEAAARTGHDTS